MYIFDQERFQSMFHAKRGERSLSQIAYEIEGVSIATLSRLESGRMPGIYTLLAICSWLQVTPGDFFINEESSTGSA
jgi:DNA-binding Xre family transcriptional regulator